MKLELIDILSAGELDKECVALKAKNNIDLGDFVILQTGRNGENVTTSVKHAFWFPYKEIKKDDVVLLFTETGRSSDFTSDDGTNVHVYHWNIDHSIWDKEDIAAVLIHGPEWTSNIASETPSPEPSSS